MPSPFLADGTDLAVNDGVGNTYADITGVLTITPPAEETAEWDSTDLNTTAGIRTKEPLSRADLGQWSFEAWNDATEYSRLVGLRGSKKNFKITYPNSAVHTIPSFIRKVEIQQMENQSPSKITVTLQVTGAITRA